MKKEEIKEVHIKLPRELYLFMQAFKKEYKVNMQEFIIDAVRNKIKNLK